MRASRFAKKRVKEQKKAAIKQALRELCEELLPENMALYIAKKAELLKEANS